MAERVVFSKPCETLNVVMKATLAIPEGVPPRTRYHKWTVAFAPVIGKRWKRDKELMKNRHKNEEDLNEGEDDYKEGDTLIFKEIWPKISLLVWPKTGGLLLLGAQSEDVARMRMREAAERLLGVLF